MSILTLRGRPVLLNNNVSIRCFGGSYCCVPTRYWKEKRHTRPLRWDCDIKLGDLNLDINVAADSRSSGWTW
ncbi:hypothetical protein BDA96_04G099500 [Sorghum bicolor]|uniref:Uncharacterized protein n=2 Tax=Sorghum bicolor TaxID=4558 RepID=A0A921UHK6_SORBI|nr:hypothetical protein SORBI_3004G091800 [Sorghum bicolor]KAG0532332.1 hypothetical protein BDA96_04G099500 [Sorghum bicolor]